MTAWENVWRRLLVPASLLVAGLTVTVAGQRNPASHAQSLHAPSQLAEAQTLLARGDSTKAIAILSDYLQAHPKDTSARLGLARAYVIAEQNDKAEAEFQTILNVAPANISALAALAELYLHEGQLDKAEAMLGRAAKASGGDPQIRMQWAVVLARLHRYPAAQNALGGLAPPKAREERIAFHRLKASVASGLGNLPGAAAEMEKALAQEPQGDGLILATAAAELQSENWHRAASLAQPLYSRTGDLQTGLVLLEAQLAMHRDFHKTLESLRATQVKPAEELAFRQRLAEILLAYGESSAAIEELRRALDLDPSRSESAYNLALAEFKAGRLDDALASAQKCKALADTADLEDLLGDIQEARGDNLGAVRGYQAAVTLAPNEEKYRLSFAVEFIRHQNFDAAREVLKQAEELWPKSWRIQLALGMVEHFAGTDEEASRLLLHAAELAPDPEVALHYLGDIQMDQVSPPAGATAARLCDYSDGHPHDGKVKYYCGALIFRRDYASGDKTHADEILSRLRSAANLLVKDASPHCQMGRVYQWMERWQEALRESETCVRMEPDSADGHYRLAQIYKHLGQPERSKQELTLHKAASERIVDQNARRDETMKTFLYTIRTEAPDHK